jgi:hypothetical protein
VDGHEHCRGSCIQRRTNCRTRASGPKPRCDDGAPDLRLAPDGVLHPPHVARQVADGAVGGARALQLEDDEVPPLVDGQDVDRPHRRRVLDPVAAGRVHIELQAPTVDGERLEALREEVPELVLKSERLRGSRTRVLLVDVARVGIQHGGNLEPASGVVRPDQPDLGLLLLDGPSGALEPRPEGVRGAAGRASPGGTASGCCRSHCFMADSSTPPATVGMATRNRFPCLLPLGAGGLAARLWRDLRVRAAGSPVVDPGAERPLVAAPPGDGRSTRPVSRRNQWEETPVPEGTGERPRRWSVSLPRSVVLPSGSCAPAAYRHGTGGARRRLRRLLA